MTRRRGWLVAGAVALLASVLFAVNEAGNATARAELEPACACARASVESTLETTGQAFYRFFEADAGEVREFMRGEVDGLCTDLEGELAFGTWNLGRSFVPRPDAGRAQRVHAILERARPRCPEVYRELFAGLGVGDADVDTMCEGLFAGMEPNDAPIEEVDVWAWPSIIDRSMCLDSAPGARANRDEPP